MYLEPNKCLLPKCVGGCIGHTVTYPKEPRWTTLCSPYVAIIRSSNEHRFFAYRAAAWFD